MIGAIASGISVLGANERLEEAKNISMDQIVDQSISIANRSALDGNIDLVIGRYLVEDKDPSKYYET